MIGLYAGVIVWIDSSINVKVSDCLMNTADCLVLEVRHLEFYFNCLHLQEYGIERYLSELKEVVINIKHYAF